LTLEQFNRLKQALSALPVLEDRRDTIDDEANSMWDDLVLGKASTFLPDTAPVRTSRADLDLRGLIERLVDLSRFMNTMKVDHRFLDALEKEARRDTFAGELVRVETAARHELDRLRSQPEVTGAPRKLRAQAVTEVAAVVFKRLTGKPATVRTDPRKNAAYGPFHEFLTAVFEACGIDASPEAQARALRRKHPQNQRP
jgi:hypothetical protein